MSHDRNGKSPPGRRSLRRNLSELLHDASLIAELQLKLLSLDAGLCLKRVRAPLIACVLGGLLLTAAVLIGLFAVVDVLVESAGWPLWTACLLVAGSAAVLAAALIATAILRLGNALTPLDRSRREFQENVGWIREVIKAHGQSEGDNVPRRGIEPRSRTQHEGRQSRGLPTGGHRQTGAN